MSEPPDDTASYADALENLRKEKVALDGGDACYIAHIRETKARDQRWAQRVDESCEIRKPETPDALGGWIVKTFCFVLMILVVTGCYAALTSDEAHLKNFLSVAQTIGLLLIGAVGFVLGHRSTQKNQ